MRAKTVLVKKGLPLWIIVRWKRSVVSSYFDWTVIYYGGNGPLLGVLVHVWFATWVCLFGSNGTLADIYFW